MISWTIDLHLRGPHVSCRSEAGNDDRAGLPTVMPTFWEP